MAVTLDYVELSDLADVMSEEEQAEASDDSYGAGGTLDESGPTRNDEMVRRFLQRAESMCNNYLVSRYSIPIDEPTPMLEYTVLILARYYLDERGDGDVSENIQNSYDQAMNWLEMIRNEEIDLGTVDEDIEDYYGERTGGTFGTYPFNDKSTAFTGEPW